MDVRVRLEVLLQRGDQKLLKRGGRGAGVVNEVARIDPLTSKPRQCGVGLCLLCLLIRRDGCGLPPDLGSHAEEVMPNGAVHDDRLDSGFTGLFDDWKQADTVDGRDHESIEFLSRDRILYLGILLRGVEAWIED